MAETTAGGAPKKRKSPATQKPAAKKSATAAKPRKPAAKQGAAKETTMTNTATPGTATDNRTEAKSRFNAALEAGEVGGQPALQILKHVEGVAVHFLAHLADLILGLGQ